MPSAPTPSFPILMTRRAALWLFAIVLCLAAGCARSQPPNIVLIVVDTLRADRIGAVGNRRGLTPFIDSLAARGYVFRNAYAPSSWTNPSVASIITSRYQSQHGVVTFESVLADSELTLPEVLKQHGYATGFFSANGLISRKMGFAQGYDVFRSILVKATDEPRYLWVPERAGRINGEALGWLDKLAEDRAGGAGLPPPPLHGAAQPVRAAPEALDHIADGARATGRRARQRLGVLRCTRSQLTPEMLTQPARCLRRRSAQPRHRAARPLRRARAAARARQCRRRDHRRPRRGVQGARAHRARQDAVRGGRSRPVDHAGTGAQRARRHRPDRLAGRPGADAGRPCRRPASRPPSKGIRSRARWCDDPNRWRLLSWLTGKPGSDGAPGSAYTELIKDAERDAKRFTPHEHAIVVGRTSSSSASDGEHEYYDLEGRPGREEPERVERGRAQQAADRLRAGPYAAPASARRRATCRSSTPRPERAHAGARLRPLAYGRTHAAGRDEPHGRAIAGRPARCPLHSAR